MSDPPSGLKQADSTRELACDVLSLGVCWPQYRKTEQEDRALERQRTRFDVNWGQVLMWSSLFVAWMYYR